MQVKSCLSSQSRKEQCGKQAFCLKRRVPYRFRRTQGFNHRELAQEEDCRKDGMPCAQMEDGFSRLRFRLFQRERKEAVRKMRLWCDVPGGEGPYADFSERGFFHPEESFQGRNTRDAMRFFPDAEIPPTREGNRNNLFAVHATFAEHALFGMPQNLCCRVKRC